MPKKQKRCNQARNQEVKHYKLNASLARDF